jgi:hypothetical protein
MRKLMRAVAIAAAMLITPVVAGAHEGHAHKVMGTISSVDGNNVMVKTTDGKAVMVMLDAKTKITREKTAVKADALKVGDRIVAEGPEQKDMVTATSIQLGAQAAAKPATKATTDTHAGHAAH